MIKDDQMLDYSSFFRFCLVILDSFRKESKKKTNNRAFEYLMTVEGYQSCRVNFDSANRDKFFSYKSSIKLSREERLSWVPETI